MEIINGLPTLKLDLTQTLALAALVLIVGYALQSRIPLFKRASIPAPIIGGLLFAVLVFALRSTNTLVLSFDATLRTPLQIAFFTTIGFSANLRLLRQGGTRIVLLLALATLLAVLQNTLGISLARVMNAPEALGVICGALTLTGGPATGLAFSAAFQDLGISGADALIIASATFGILASSLVANPVATFLIRRFQLATPRNDSEMDKASTADSLSQPQDIESSPPDATIILRSLLLLLLTMGGGAWLSKAIESISIAGKNITLPAYIGAMILAAVIRNADDRTRVFNLNFRALETIGAISLALFLALALMDLKLWQLAGLALPALVILVAQIVLTILFAAVITFFTFGKNYEAAVTASGHIGFGLGITPNAVANMEALTKRFQAAPQSFLSVPLVGAFFIDFTNALVITLFINFLK